ncbi:Dabb family protein [Flavihumibacter sp. UBA7668]|uniref:Dabb family protein n=1 Tax=Flavihumibacter sp. UBA7668 TaxID=1946542 RepID=UPI0025B8C46E|nr:Dabb family protein [Flavihumibacter sp. UBA7668]
MHKFFVIVIIGFLMNTSLNAQTNQQHHKQLRHVVLFSFKTTSSAEEIKKVEEAFRALPSQIKEIRDFEWGTNNSPENLNQDFTHCFLVSFATEKDREIYLPHPAHKAFVDELKPHLEKVLVIDYWATR